MEMTTMSTIKAFFESNEIFTMFAGAVFALHQDTLRVYAIDMRRTDDILLGAAMDKMRPSTLGDFPTRIGLTMEAMNGVDNMNLDMLDKLEAPPHFDKKEYELHLLMARMRSTAARLWLMTIYSKVKGGGGSSMKLGVFNMWTMLQMVPRNALHDDAKMFTGTFYNNVRSEPMDLTMWPQSP